MTAADRKRAELAAKLDSVRTELAEWRAHSEAGRPLEKHHSQIQRITTRIDVLADLVAADLDAENDLLGNWQQIELRLLDLHHVWDFFRSKFALRCPAWIRDTLVVADELIWACYQPAQQQAVKAGGVDLAAVREPPLAFFGTDTSPLALSRHAVYRRRGRAEDLYTTLFADELKSLPVPVTVIPWHQAGHVPDLLLLAHETGHQVEDDFGLTPHLRAAGRAALSAAGAPEHRVTAWMGGDDSGWLGEVFADIYGVLGVGAAFVVALTDFLAAPAEAIAAEQASAAYPTAHLRIQVALAALRVTCPTDPRAAELTAAWTGAHALSDFSMDVEPLVKGLLAGPYAVFGGRSLTSVLSFGSRWPETAIDVARLAEPDQPLQAGDPRTLLAAATLSFAADPAAYREHHVGTRVLERVRDQQAKGTRFRSAVAVRPGLIEADRAAAVKLYQRLADARSR
ncbi:hypothetical protein [Actinoplanes solisilvae]|uniref:hypothetical protein n=1 Tax=Actinoplanes solisilvae TaxID=2486853 RepID=UPI000FD9DDDB|nr:hypothetical protein [Actinoplanes solisilvae]